PEWMKPTILAVDAVEGELSAPPAGPRWIAYGDSVLEGWVATSPALAWPMVAARTHGLDVVNMGYAGSARGEIVSAEHICALEAGSHPGDHARPALADAVGPAVAAAAARKGYAPVARPAPGADRVVRVLDFLAAHPDEPFTLSELARRLELNKATAHALLVTL